MTEFATVKSQLNKTQSLIKMQFLFHLNVLYVQYDTGAIATAIIQAS